MQKNLTSNIFERIYHVVAQIPSGKVTTYGAIARNLNIKNPRVVGFALHANKNPKAIPCHRVIKQSGELAGGYVFGGNEIQAQKLRNEQINVVNNKVDLNVYFWDPQNIN